MMMVKYTLMEIGPKSFEFLESAYEGDDPGAAILAWFQENRKYPMCVSISISSADAAKELFKWAASHMDQLRASYEEGCCYKWEFMISCINKNLNNIDHSFRPDAAMDPFSMG